MITIGYMVRAPTGKRGSHKTLLQLNTAAPQTSRQRGDI